MNKERSAEQSISFNRAVNMVILCNDFFIEHQYCMVSFILTFRILCARKAFCEAPLISAKRQEFKLSAIHSSRVFTKHLSKRGTYLLFDK
jgi:hypothetical protein